MNWVRMVKSFPDKFSRKPKEFGLTVALSNSFDKYFSNVRIKNKLIFLSINLLKKGI
jgi:hypothetical protein